MHELPKDLTNSLRSFRGSIYGRGQSRQGDQSARLEDADLEKETQDYGDKEFDRALNTSQSSLDMQSATSAPNMDQIQPDPRDEGVDLEKQDQVLRFEDQEDQEDQYDEEDDMEQGADRPRVNTTMDGARQPTHLTPNTPAKRSILQGAHVKDLDPAADRLAEDLTPLTTVDFYELMGLNPPTGTKEGMGELMKPHGLYSKLVRHTRYTHRKYRAFAIAVYVFLVLQLMISAVFIILGSLRNVDTHITIAVLGAVSTIIAGGLALMQGQGLPNRLRQTRDGLRAVIFAAEELYWDLKSGRPVLYKDVKKIREDYLRVLEDQKKNNPDVWTAAARDVEQGAARPGGAGKGKKAG